MAEHHHSIGLHTRRPTQQQRDTPDTVLADLDLRRCSSRRTTELSDHDTTALVAAPEPVMRPTALSSIGLTRPSARSSMIIGALSLFICILAFVGQTVIIRNVQESYVQPYFILWFSHSFWVIMLPLHTVYEKTKRSSRSLAALRLETLVASAKLIVQRGHVSSEDPETMPRARATTSGQASAAADYHRVQTDDLDSEDVPHEVFKVADNDVDDDDDDDDNGDLDAGGSSCDDGSRSLALRRPGWVLVRMLLLTVLLAGLLNASAYLWYVAVGFTSMSKVTAIYNMSCFFAYLFSILLLHDRVRVAKCAAVAISIVGVVFMTLTDSDADAQALSPEQQSAVHRQELIGDLLSLLCACGIGLYQVLYKKYAVPRDFHSLYHVNFMTTLLGLATFVLYWVPVPLLSITGIERFHWPNSKQLGYIVANALFGVAYNGGFMIALALTSPLFAAIGVMLTIPVMAVVDMVVQGQVLAWNVFVGGGSILVGFFILTFAEYRETVDKAQADESDADANQNAADTDTDPGSAFREAVPAAAAAAAVLTGGR
ncbi:hypothetical protein J3B02_001959 [Coemansia erecta]|uniref:EamA domain-containing protein n=1 Tax=Coemansia asiatica TaxID=1052880 RepID=A0A9W8CJH1_9FUNG|nr:hypothetical protein LPJ64_004028 [Coemansia asiatica]KAJ2855816.1 hypothetical protein J3B02_001959 [Coemansia erecta]